MSTHKLGTLGSWLAITGFSVGFHVFVFGELDGAAWGTPMPSSKAPAFVEMTATKKPAPVVEAPADKPAQAKLAARRLAVASPSAKSAVPRPAAAPTQAPVPVAAETPADFTGTTLTNGSGAGWASATGNGEAMHGPVGRPGARVTSRQVESAAPVKAAKPTVVAVADLSRPPVPPSLDEALERNYPAEARRMGQAGKAVVRARISAQGGAQELLVVSESATGFGESCKQTLAGSHWTAPLDRDGNPVATVIQYTCRFVVR
jgi:outer membrane biosynthesis protein TonB